MFRKVLPYLLGMLVLVLLSIATGTWYFIVGGIVLFTLDAVIHSKTKTTVAG
jgi:hypothetical protein